MVNLQFFDMICAPTDNLHHQAGKLSKSDMSILRAYSFKVNEHITDKAFAKIPHAFPSDPVPSIDICKSRVQFLSGLKPERYDCCINSCCCFTGRHKDCTKCPYCGEDRHKTNHRGKQKPCKSFNYLPFIPHLVAMYANPTKATEQRYRAFDHSHTLGKITDVFDSQIYRDLLGRKVVVDRKILPHKYFSDPRDIALGLSTDGFGPQGHSMASHPIQLQPPTQNTV